MRNYCLAFCFVLATSPIQAQDQPIYKWTDSSGDTHFSDKPHPGAEQIELPKAQTYSSPKIPPQDNSTAPVTNAEASTYDNISIAEPNDQTTIRNTQGYVSILVELKPKLKSGDRVQIIFDGTPVGEPQASTVFALQDILRGSHTLAAQVMDNKGKVLKTSDLITIFMMPPRVGMGRNTH